MTTKGSEVIRAYLNKQSAFTSSCSELFLLSSCPENKSWNIPWKMPVCQQANAGYSIKRGLRHRCFPLSFQFFQRQLFFSCSLELGGHLLGIFRTAWKVSKYEVFLVRIFPYSDHKKLHIWTLFTQCGRFDCLWWGVDVL